MTSNLTSLALSPFEIGYRLTLVKKNYNSGEIAGIPKKELKRSLFCLLPLHQNASHFGFH